ncbi:uncharacterized protein B0H18DRAFT_1102251 [Fomitopsis serialis]|uniref:uncharacterized protein n=1 Tax=Fomitopsis serialis TaxID=139415 RepID=UPI0020079A4A|nr:uncharacterized protein B0H18DRAFT_1102251 [Neoantrodia serialis]KAH9932432.1 hypothetical protein B0H18DRAFT_1102251 [Neoantrodia serialis]
MNTNYQTIRSDEAVVNATAISGMDEHDAFILEYVDEADIMALSLLPHLLPPKADVQSSHYDLSGASSTSSLSTQTKTTEDNEGHSLDGRYPAEASVAGRYPVASLPISSTQHSDDDDDWSVALGTYDFLGIESAKHATTRVRIPLTYLDHFAEWRSETEEFAEMWDLLRETEPVVNSPIASTLVEYPHAEDGPGLLLAAGTSDEEGRGCMPDAVLLPEVLDEIIPGLRSVGEMMGEMRMTD